MKWKQKYIVGITVMSMLFALPLVSAEEDDVVVFGDEFDNNSLSTTESIPANGENTAVETPQSQNNETVNSGDNDDNTNSDDVDMTPSDPPDNLPIEDIMPPKAKSNIDEIKPEIEITHLSNDNPSVQEIVDEANREVEVANLSSNSDNSNQQINEIVDTINSANNVAEEVEYKPFITNDNTIYDDAINDRNDYTTSINHSADNNIYRSGDETPSYFRSLIKSSSVNNEEKETEKKKMKKQKARFVKLLSDDSYDYYLDRNAVRWLNMPYSTSEYMADVWIRMIEKSPNRYNDIPSDLYDHLSAEDDEINDAATKGIAYDEVDVRVLRSKKYFLEHYYIRPKTRQIQFLCELEVIGRPQNTISERPYEYKNWEGLIPGSVESSIYNGVLSEIGTGKAGKRGHMTFVDMLDEYARIALN